MSLWVQALRIWNKGERETKGAAWSIPRKGTEGYDEVREIMDYLRENPNFFKGAESTVSEIEAEGPQSYGKKKTKKQRKGM